MALPDDGGSPVFCFSSARAFSCDSNNIVLGTYTLTVTNAASFGYVCQPANVTITNESLFQVNLNCTAGSFPLSINVTGITGNAPNSGVFSIAPTSGGGLSQLQFFNTIGSQANNISLAAQTNYTTTITPPAGYNCTAPDTYISSISNSITVNCTQQTFKVSGTISFTAASGFAPTFRVVLGNGSAVSPTNVSSNTTAVQTVLFNDVPYNSAGYTIGGMPQGYNCTGTTGIVVMANSSVAFSVNCTQQKFPVLGLITFSAISGNTSPFYISFGNGNGNSATLISSSTTSAQTVSFTDVPYNAAGYTISGLPSGYSCVGTTGIVVTSNTSTFNVNCTLQTFHILGSVRFLTQSGNTSSFYISFGSGNGISTTRITSNTSDSQTVSFTDVPYNTAGYTVSGLPSFYTCTGTTSIAVTSSSSTFNINCTIQTFNISGSVTFTTASTIANNSSFNASLSAFGREAANSPTNIFTNLTTAQQISFSGVPYNADGYTMNSLPAGYICTSITNIVIISSSSTFNVTCILQTFNISGTITFSRESGNTNIAKASLNTSEFYVLSGTGYGDSPTEISSNTTDTQTLSFNNVPYNATGYAISGLPAFYICSPLTNIVVTSAASTFNINCAIKTFTISGTVAFNVASVNASSFSVSFGSGNGSAANVSNGNTGTQPVLLNDVPYNFTGYTITGLPTAGYTCSPITNIAVTSAASKFNVICTLQVFNNISGSITFSRTSGNPVSITPSLNISSFYVAFPDSNSSAISSNTQPLTKTVTFNNVPYNSAGYTMNGLPSFYTCTPLTNITITSASSTFNIYCTIKTFSISGTIRFTNTPDIPYPLNISFGSGNGNSTTNVIDSITTIQSVSFSDVPYNAAGYTLMGIPSFYNCINFTNIVVVSPILSTAFTVSCTIPPSAYPVITANPSNFAVYGGISYVVPVSPTTLSFIVSGGSGSYSSAVVNSISGSNPSLNPGNCPLNGSIISCSNITGLAVANTYTYTLTITDLNGLRKTTSFPFSVQGYSFFVLADAPLGFWRFNDATGPLALDSSGHGYHASYISQSFNNGLNGASVQSSVTLGGNGINYGTPNFGDTGGGSVYLPGGPNCNSISGATVANANCTQAYIATPYNFCVALAAQSSAGFTFEGWLYATVIEPAWTRIFDFGSAAGYSLWYTASAGGSDPALNSTGGNGVQTFFYFSRSGTPLPPGRWMHYAATIDSSNNARIYINGVPSISGTLGSFSPSTVLSAGLSFPTPTCTDWFGRSHYIVDPYFKGYFSNFAIYASVLTPEHIYAHYIMH